MVRSLRQQKAEAARLGIIVRRVPRTGEVRFLDPDGEEPPVTVNNRRKDGTREVERLIRKREPMPTAPPKPPRAAKPATPPAVPPKMVKSPIAGKTIETVLREMATEEGVDERIVAIIKRIDRKREKAATKAAEEGQELA